MSRGAVVLRPEPGNAATAARLSAMGLSVRCCPLFAVMPVEWAPPDAGSYDALLLTSANAVRYAGAGLGRLAQLPVLAVGDATAVAAEAAGLEIVLTGTADATALLDRARTRGWRRLLHLAGRDRHALADITAITVYASEPLPIGRMEVAGWADQVALLHSPRAARHFAALIDGAGIERARIGIAALSRAVAEGAGAGWRAMVTAAAPRDNLLVAATRALIDRLEPAADKQA